MSERFPDDAALLALTQDEVTGVPYIPTGASPYHLLFRRMLHRLLRVAERANDLRVFADGEQTVGVRPGRCFVGEQAVVFEGEHEIALAPSATAWLWLDAAGEVQSASDALPSDRSTFIPLARVLTSASGIESITDLRGEAMIAAPSAIGLGITASSGEINQALDGISEQVTALALNFLCAGPTATADALHRHTQMYAEVADEAGFRIINDSDDANASVALRLALPSIMTGDTRLEMDRDTGWLRQRRPTGGTWCLLGSVQSAYQHQGELAADVTDRLIGAVPVDGEVFGVALSIGGNIESDDASDHVIAAVKVNGTALCTVDPAIEAGDGAGFRSTAQGHGTEAVIKDDGTQQVQRGDLLTVDLARVVNGNVTEEPRHVAVLISIRNAGPA